MPRAAKVQEAAILNVNPAWNEDIFRTIRAAPNASAEASDPKITTETIATANLTAFRPQPFD